MAIITLKPPVDPLKLANGKHSVAAALDRNKQPKDVVTGLRLVVRGASRLWEYRYVMNGQERFLSLGAYSTANTVHHAIQARDVAYEMIRAGDDPKLARERQKSEARVAALESENSPSYRDFVMGLKADVPVLASSYNQMIRYGVTALGEVADLKPSEITFADLKRVFESKWDKATGKWAQPGVAQQMAVHVRRLLFLAREDKLIVDPHWENPCSLARLQRKIGVLPETQHRKAIAEADIGDLMIALRAGKDGQQQMDYLCIQMAVLALLRSFVVRSIRRTWVDREARLIRIPRKAMKAGMKGVDKSVTHFNVPLTPAMVRVLDQADALWADQKRSPFVFPSNRSKTGHLCNTTLLNKLAELGFRDNDAARGDRVCTHGYRSAFSDWANAQVETKTNPDGTPIMVDGEKLTDSRWSSKIVDQCLGHSAKGKTESAYWRSLPPEPRRGVMQAWSAFLEPKVVQLDARRPAPDQAATG